MKAGIALSGRKILAAVTAVLLLLSMMFLLGEPPAKADHIPATGPLPENCVNFQAGTTGMQSPIEYPSVDITLVSWTDSPGDPHTVNFTISGLTGGQYVDISVKSGTTVQEAGPYGNGSFGYSNGLQNAISHIRLCVFEETPTTSPTTTPTTSPTTTPTTTPTTSPTTTPTTPPGETGEIIVEKVVLGDGSQTFEFTFNTIGFTLADNTLAHGQSSSSGPVAVGSGYSVSEVVPDGWTQMDATCSDGSPVGNIDVSANEVVTCTFFNEADLPTVGASIVVTVGGSCVVNGDQGSGLISVTVSVADGASVVVSDSDGGVVGTFSSDGSVTVPEGAVYSWVATPSEGFEFPAGSETSGTVTIETCSTSGVLPFTGGPIGTLGIIAVILLSTGLVLVTASHALRSGKAT